MEWINLVGFFLVVTTTLIGFVSYVVACSPYRIGDADEEEGSDVVNSTEAA